MSEQDEKRSALSVDEGKMVFRWLHSNCGDRQTAARIISRLAADADRIITSDSQRLALSDETRKLRDRLCASDAAVLAVGREPLLAIIEAHAVELGAARADERAKAQELFSALERRMSLHATNGGDCPYEANAVGMFAAELAMLIRQLRGAR
jgi:hypothetical protein